MNEASVSEVQLIARNKASVKRRWAASSEAIVTARWSGYSALYGACMRVYLMKHGVVLATVGVAGFVLLLGAGAVWGVVILKVYVRLWSPYIHDYKAAARIGDPML